MAGRFGYPLKPDEFKVTLHPDRMDQPFGWRSPQKIFVCSMSDLFHEDIGVLDSTYVRDVFATMALCLHHTFQILTKRVSLAYLGLTETFAESVEWSMRGLCNECGWTMPEFTWPLPNVWIGTSVSTQADVAENVTMLRNVPAVVRFVSVEPLLERIDMRVHLASNSLFKIEWFSPGWDYHGEEQEDGSVIAVREDGERYYDGLDIHWIIVGGESGPNARPMHPDWARDLRDQCKRAGAAFFFKQWGEWRACDGPPAEIPKYHEWSRGRCCQVPGSPLMLWRVGKKRAGRLLDGVEYSELPEV